MGSIKRVIAVAVLLMTAGCNHNPLKTGSDPENDILSRKSSVHRESDPQVTALQVDQLVSGNTRFAADLYRDLSKDNKNVFISPFSISMALAMTRAGAINQTAVQIDSTLRFSLSDSLVHRTFNYLDLQLKSRDGATLSIVNQAWGRADLNFQDAYLDILAINYGSGMNLLNFGSDPEGSRQIINAWVADNTNDKITNLLPPQSITENTALVLTNAIYFLGDWLFQFKQELTSDHRFFLENGDSLSVPMMSLCNEHRTISLNYVRTPFCRAVELPYSGNNFSMVIVLPTDKSLSEFNMELTKERLDTITNGFHSTELFLKIPKFSFTTETISLKRALQSMGMINPFTAEADFSGITGIDHPLTISDIFHKAFIRVDEKGTEAAAATAVVFVDSAVVRPDDHNFTADRPFLFLIRDRISNTVLFIGNIMNPAQI
ncbi:MAG: serpin family protein [Fibrobacter sp.]|nr:serpin family protein [Fibrobacter sp.]